MSIDLQQAQLALDMTHRARPIRGKVYVNEFINAFYFGEDDLVRWISQNWESFQAHHMVSLITCGVGAKMKTKKKTELIQQVRSLYDPPTM